MLLPTMTKSKCVTLLTTNISNQYFSPFIVWARFKRRQCCCSSFMFPTCECEKTINKTSKKRITRSFSWGAFSFLFFAFFIIFPNAWSKINQMWIVFSICIDGATLKMLFLCVLWFARKLAQTDRQTDKQTDTANTYISVFSPMKTALKTY